MIPRHFVLHSITGAAIVIARLCPSQAAGAHSVPEPPGLWLGPMHGDTPATLKGATVIDVKQLATILKQKPTLIDVANLERKPGNMPPDMPWDPIHRSIPGASWLPGAGNGRGDLAFKDAVAAEAEHLTGGDKDKPIVTFCHPQRWGSWNVAKRLTDLGYRHVYWFPGGAEGWSDQGQTIPVKEEPRWKKVGLDKDAPS